MAAPVLVFTDFASLADDSLATLFEPLTRGASPPKFGESLLDRPVGPALRVIKIPSQKSPSLSGCLSPSPKSLSP